MLCCVALAVVRARLLQHEPWVGASVALTLMTMLAASSVTVPVPYGPCEPATPRDLLRALWRPARRRRRWM